MARNNKKIVSVRVFTFRASKVIPETHIKNPSQKLRPSSVSRKISPKALFYPFLLIFIYLKAIEKGLRLFLSKRFKIKDRIIKSLL